MKPAELIPPEVLQRCTGVAFDVDDTVTTHGRLTSDVLRAMERMRSAGLHLIAATGRPLAWAQCLAAQWPVNAVVAENGAAFLFRVSNEGGQLQQRTTVPDAEAHRLKERRQLLQRTVERHMPHVHLSSDHLGRHLDLAFDLTERHTLGTAERDRLETLLRAEGANVVRSSIHMHAELGTWDKFTGIRHAHGELFDTELEQERWLFVGDSPNDQSCFEGFSNSVGVQNVQIHIHRLAHLPTYVTRLPMGDGFCEVANLCLRARNV